MGKVTSVHHKFKNVEPIAYQIWDISNILGISMSNTYSLLKAEQFPVLITVKKKIVPIKPFHKWLELNYPQIPLPKFYELPQMVKDTKNSYSVAEIRAMLGMKKTSAYEMIKQDKFEKIIIQNHIRITRASFEAWFHSKDYLMDSYKIYEEV